jgi:amidophosphoribosyltransferase
MINSDKLHEECAVFAVTLKKGDAAGVVYNGLLSLQHRGQESAGMAAARGGAIVCHKDQGLVGDVLGNKIDLFKGSSVVIGHCRYSMNGPTGRGYAQPFVTEALTGRVAAAHNGNVTNAHVIREELQKIGFYFDTTSDNEVVSALTAYYANRSGDILEGVVRAAQRLTGAFSMVLLNGNEKLIALRDPNGFRPLCIGENENGIAFASESCALEGCGYRFVRDVLPGEVIMAENGQITYEAVRLPNRDEKKQGLCLFEYVYFARPDSVIDGVSVYDARVKMGKILAREHQVDADVVCGVPDSGVEAAIGYSIESSIPFVLGFMRNRYLGRSFIYPDQMQRESIVKLKLNPLTAAIGGKRVILVDDSVVRGTTSEQIIRSLKDAGAKEVHMRISSPPFKHTCLYGTDIGDESELIANRMNLDEIIKSTGADSWGYLSLNGLKEACAGCKLPFCQECFDKE